MVDLHKWGKPIVSTLPIEIFNDVKTLLKSISPSIWPDYRISFQGSHRNGTNISKTSDIDIIVCLYSDLMTDNFYRVSSYNTENFREDVLEQLSKKYYGVTECNKAISISDFVAPVDVLVCGEYHNCNYDKGIWFYTRNDNRLLVNYPEHHIRNCSIKDQDTNGRFKSIVRIFKNIRNKILTSDIAPSYLLEGMLWNVDSDIFLNQKDDVEIIIDILTWLQECAKIELLCANGIQPLIQENWNNHDYELFLTETKKFIDSI